MPDEAFFQWNPEILGLGRQIGQINSGAFGEFSAKLSAPISAQWVYMFSIIQPLFQQKKLSSYIHVSNISLGLGFEFGRKELGI